MSDAIHASGAPKAVGRYPHARRVGDLLFLSGIGPRTPGDDTIPGNVHDDDGTLVAYDIVAQCHSVFANVRAVLLASGARWQDLVDVTVYLTDMGAFTEVNEVYGGYFGDSPPARVAIGVAALPKGAQVEMDAVLALEP